jgi:hypothetical protein
MAFGALLGWFALVLQFYLTISSSLADGKTLVGALLFYFSFFTILTNLLVALQYSFLLWSLHSAAGRWFSRSAVQAGSAVYIVIVAVTYSLLLRNIWNPRGWQKVADVLLHDVSPLLGLGYWLFFAPKDGLRWSDAGRWLVYPLGYLVYSLARGAVTGTYPYPFIDASVIGYRRTMSNTGLMAIAFLAVGLVFVALGRWLGGRQATAVQ